METTQAIDALAALAQASRLAVYRLLVEQGPEGLPAGAIGEKLELPPATLSFHLAHLARAGLVRSRQEGRFVDLQRRLRKHERPGRLSHRELLRREGLRARQGTQTRKECRMKRFHVHVSVHDLQQSIRFYSTLFAAQPSVAEGATTPSGCSRIRA